MAGLSISKFTMGITSAVVCVILLVTVAVPIISSNQVASTVTNANSINAMINVLPIIICVGIVVALIALFISGRE